MRSYELKATTQKSYYKKAYILEDENGNKFLQSYKTVVCGIMEDGFCRFWDGYSVTTLNHINDFCRLYGCDTFNKKAWDSYLIESCPVSKYDLVDANLGNQNYGLGY